MKTQKIFLLALMLMLIFSLASCGAKKDQPDCFVIGEQASFADSTELKGKVVAYNSQFDLVALETTSISSYGSTTRTVKVIDLADENRVLLTDENYVSANSTTPPADYDLSNYPVIKVVDYSPNGTDDYDNPIYKEYYSYYLISDEEYITVLDENLSEDDLEVTPINNIYLVEHNGKLSWVDSDFDIMREILIETSESYVKGNYENYFAFNAEYKNFLYTWDFNPETFVQAIIVYGPNGVASAQYNFSAGTAYIDGIGSTSIIDPKAFVLNNGNVLIQECILVEGDGEYDFVYGAQNQKFKLATKIMDFMNGAITNVDYGYIVADLESAYAQQWNSDFAFTLAEGYDNQALLISIDGGVLGRKTEYAVLSNVLECKYTLTNDYLANSSPFDENYGYRTIFDADKEGYTAVALVDGKSAVCRFGWDGSIVTKYPVNMTETVADCYVTNSGIYRTNGTLVFDLEEFGYSYINVVGDAVYVYKRNFQKNALISEEEGCRYPTECYKIDLKSGNATLVSDGVDESFRALSMDGAYGVYNIKKGTQSFYNKDGEVVLIIHVDDLVENCSTAHTQLLNVCVDGEYKLYVLYIGDQAIAPKGGLK